MACSRPESSAAARGGQPLLELEPTTHLEPSSTAIAPYADRHSLLYHLSNSTFVGTLSTEGANYASSLDDLIGSFHSAQINALARREAALDDKALRKSQWADLGVPLHLLIPTLLQCELQLDEDTRVEAPEFVEDDEGEWVPCLELDEITMRPAQGHEAAEVTMMRLIEASASGIVVKPLLGTNSAGVLLLSSTPHDPFAPLPLASGQQRALGATSRESTARLPAQHIWAVSPSKSTLVRETLRSVPKAEWFETLVLRNHALVGQAASAPDGDGKRRFLAEAAIPHDQELCVLAVNGGRVQVLAGRTNCMERLLMLDDETTLVAATDFLPPSCRRGAVLDAAVRGAHTAMVLEQIVHGDEAGRTLHHVIRSTVRAVSEGIGAAAVRCDFFVRWGVDGAPCTLLLNEVEHSFSAGSMVGWFGAPNVDLALRLWALGGDARQRQRLEKELAGAAPAVPAMPTSVPAPTLPPPPLLFAAAAPVVAPPAASELPANGPLHSTPLHPTQLTGPAAQRGDKATALSPATLTPATALATAVSLVHLPEDILPAIATEAAAVAAAVAPAAVAAAVAPATVAAAAPTAASPIVDPALATAAAVAVAAAAAAAGAAPVVVAAAAAAPTSAAAAAAAVVVAAAAIIPVTPAPGGAPDVSTRIVIGLAPIAITAAAPIAVTPAAAVATAVATTIAPAGSAAAIAVAAAATASAATAAAIAVAALGGWGHGSGATGARGRVPSRERAMAWTEWLAQYHNHLRLAETAGSNMSS